MPAAREVICCVSLLAGQAVWAQVVCAQAIDVDPGLGHGFVSIGFTAGGGDAADERSRADNAHGKWLVHGAVFVARGLAVGVETMPEHRADDITIATLTLRRGLRLGRRPKPFRVTPRILHSSLVLMDRS
jgi:hypothetical protein